MLLLAAAFVSTFLPSGGGTAWLKQDVAGPHKQVVATFPGPPGGARAAWSANRKRGMVWFDPENRGYIHEQEEPMPAGATLRLFQVDLQTHATRPLTLPPVGKLQDAGYDASGAALALTLQEAAFKPDPKGGQFTMFEGRRYVHPAGREGLPVLVHAFRLEPDFRWKRVETTVSTTGWDYAQGVDALGVAKTLGARSSQWLTSHPEHTEVKDASRLPKIKGSENDGWMRLAGSPGPVYFWSITGEFLHSTGRIVLGTTLAPGLPWGDRDAVALNRRGNYLLAACAGSGSHPRVWDVPTRKLVYAADTAWDTVFWPE